MQIQVILQGLPLSYPNKTQLQRVDIKEDMNVIESNHK